MTRRPGDRGSMSLLAVAFTAGLAGVLLLLLAFYQVWLTYMRSQMVADAAAWGALEGLRPGMEAELARRAQVNVNAFWGTVNATVSERVADWEDWYRRWYEPNPDDFEDEETYREAYQQFLAELREGRTDRRRSYREQEVRRRKPEIAGLLLSGRPLPLSVQVQYFLSAQERGCAIQAAARDHAGEMTAVARRITTANEGDLADSPDLVVEEGVPGILARVALPLRLLLSNANLAPEHRSLEGRARVQIRAVAGVPVRVPDTCP